jgi:hypothetical protein
MELLRAITLTWLFAGQRSDEIARLRVGCIRWQHDGMPIPGYSAEVLARDAVCLLDVPTHKTGTAFAKPVDPLVGQAIEAWQAVRPQQPKMLDRKTGDHADFLFPFRARRVTKHYINDSITPMLCRKAGVPDADVRGNITSHRARSTIASQLYNAKEPMTLCSNPKPGSATASSAPPSTTPAPDATSTPRKTPPRRCCWRPRTTCSECSPASLSPTMNAPRSMTGRPRWTSFWPGSPTSRPRQAPSYGSPVSRPHRRSCRSWTSARNR